MAIKSISSGLQLRNGGIRSNPSTKNSSLLRDKVVLPRELRTFSLHLVFLGCCTGVAFTWAGDVRDTIKGTQEDLGLILSRHDMRTLAYSSTREADKFSMKR